MSEEILDLNTIVTRPCVRIRWSRFPNGKLYELVDVSDLAIVPHAKILTLTSEVDQLNKLEFDNGKLTKKQQETRDRTLREVVTMLLPSVEKKALAELTNAQCEAILATWSRHNAGEGGRPPRKRRTTAK